LRLLALVSALLRLFRHGDRTIASGHKHAHVVSVEQNLLELCNAVPPLRVDLRWDPGVRA